MSSASSQLRRICERRDRYMKKSCLSLGLCKKKFQVDLIYASLKSRSLNFANQRFLFGIIRPRHETEPFHETEPLMSNDASNVAR